MSVELQRSTATRRPVYVTPIEHDSIVINPNVSVGVCEAIPSGGTIEDYGRKTDARRIYPSWLHPDKPLRLFVDSRHEKLAAYILREVQNSKRARVELITCQTALGCAATKAFRESKNQHVTDVSPEMVGEAHEQELIRMSSLVGAYGSQYQGSPAVLTAFLAEAGAQKFAAQHPRIENEEWLAIRSPLAGDERFQELFENAYAKSHHTATRAPQYGWNGPQTK